MTKLQPHIVTMSPCSLYMKYRSAFDLPSKYIPDETKISSQLVLCFVDCILATLLTVRGPVNAAYVYLFPKFQPFIFAIMRSKNKTKTAETQLIRWVNLKQDHTKSSSFTTLITLYQVITTHRNESYPITNRNFLDVRIKVGIKRNTKERTAHILSLFVSLSLCVFISILNKMMT